VLRLLVLREEEVEVVDVGSMVLGVVDLHDFTTDDC